MPVVNFTGPNNFNNTTSRRSYMKSETKNRLNIYYNTVLGKSENTISIIRESTSTLPSTINNDVANQITESNFAQTYRNASAILTHASRDDKHNSPMKYYDHSRCQTTIGNVANKIVLTYYYSLE